MIELKRQQHIRMAKIERADAWLIVAVVYEKQGDEMIALTEPKIVKIIPKQIKALAGSVAVQTLTLAAGYAAEQKEVSLVSPYISIIFGFTNSEVVTGLAPQPPTII